MSVVITKDDLRAYTEVDYIINHMNVKYREKVPQKMLTFFGSIKDPDYEVKINPYVPLQNQGLQRYALEIIALLHLKYWCEDEERKKELYDIMLSNQEKLEEQMRQKYSVEKLFETPDKEETNNSQEDFSRPRVVQRYSDYAQKNEDIKDFTDHVEVAQTAEPNESVDSQLPADTTQTESKGFIQKIFDMFRSIFSKK